MCGICGFTQATSADTPALKAMCDIMAHRGPDGEGQYLDAESGIALGHRRLSLIDLANGNQPMVRATGEHDSGITSPALMPDGTPCGTPESMLAKGEFAIVFNGEIYNYQDLRAELETQGWQFKTKSDTEVLLTGYLAWGEGVLDRLRGMFAFAIWNRATRELFCARDFFGIKPFYYTQQNGQFIFASEIKCILEHPAYTRELNREALEQYLCFQFSALPETFFKGIFKLAPAHCMTVHADGSITERRYWRPEYHFDENRNREDTARAIDEVMRDSVRYHNVADVEVGSFLSSGIDSSYMAACLAKENPDIKTFTVGFECYKQAAANNAEGAGGKTMRDEISWARELADDLHIANTDKYIGEEEYWASLPRVQWHMDEPSADPSAVALYFVDQIAATQVKAVLSGEGADEFFGGYRIYQTPFSNAKLSWAPKGLLRGASSVMRKLGNDRSRARTGAAAHTGSDKDHVGALERLRNGSLGLLCGLLADLRLGACAHAAGQLLADLDLILALGFVEVLLIGIDRHKIDALYTAGDHSVDNVITGAADADDLDRYNLLSKVCHLFSSYVCHSIKNWKNAY